jgi:hypothetical protein
MKYLIIILILFSSCSSKLMINGVPVRQKNGIPQREKPILLTAFLAGYFITPMIIK